MYHHPQCVICMDKSTLTRHNAHKMDTIQRCASRHTERAKNPTPYIVCQLSYFNVKLEVKFKMHSDLNHFWQTDMTFEQILKRFMRLVSFKRKRPNSTKTQWSFSITLRHHVVNLARCYLPWKFHGRYVDSVVLWSSFETFTATALSVGDIVRKIDFDLHLRFLILFVEFFHQFVDKHVVHVRRKNLSLNLFVKISDEVKNAFVKSFQSRSGLSALLKIGARCRKRTRLNGRPVRNDRWLPDQNRITGMWLSYYAVKKATQGLAEVEEKW